MFLDSNVSHAVYRWWDRHTTWGLMRMQGWSICFLMSIYYHFLILVSKPSSLREVNNIFTVTFIEYLRYHSHQHTHLLLLSKPYQVCLCTLCCLCSSVWVTPHHVLTCSHSAQFPSCSYQSVCPLCQLQPCPALGSWARYPTRNTVQDHQEVISLSTILLAALIFYHTHGLIAFLLWIGDNVPPDCIL